MAFENWREFLSMGHYAFYVWSAVGVTLLTLLIQGVVCVKQHAQVMNTLKAQESDRDVNAA